MYASFPEPERDDRRDVNATTRPRGYHAPYRGTHGSSTQEGDADGEALYRRGLHQVFEERNLGAAARTFKRAARGCRSLWADAARLSLALCQFQEGKINKAMDELRRAGSVNEPTDHSVMALELLEYMLCCSGRFGDVAGVRAARIAQLERLALARTPDWTERSEYLCMLACALREHGDIAGAQSAWLRAYDMGFHEGHSQQINPSI